MGKLSEMSGTDSLIAELRGHLEHGISSEAIEAAADAIATLTVELDYARVSRDGYVKQATAREAEHDRLLQALTAERDALREALAPFAEFAENVDEDGWTSNIHREPISTWFGPSDFRRARALAKGEGK